MSGSQDERSEMTDANGVAMAYTNMEQVIEINHNEKIDWKAPLSLNPLRFVSKNIGR